MSDSKRPLFEIGLLALSGGVFDLIETRGINVCPYLDRHVHGDWGDVTPERAQLNQEALGSGDRLLSSYVITSELTILIVTESDRSLTLIHFPDEYPELDPAASRSN